MHQSTALKSSGGIGGPINVGLVANDSTWRFELCWGETKVAERAMFLSALCVCVEEGGNLTHVNFKETDGYGSLYCPAIKHCGKGAKSVLDPVTRERCQTITVKTRRLPSNVKAMYFVLCYPVTAKYAREYTKVRVKLVDETANCIKSSYEKYKFNTAKESFLMCCVRRVGNGWTVADLVQNDKTCHGYISDKETYLFGIEHEIRQVERTFERFGRR
jgi:hypothetical protein